MRGPSNFRLSCAFVYRQYYYYKFPDLFDSKIYDKFFSKPLKEMGLKAEDVRTKEALRVWLDSIGNTFINGTQSPFRNVKPN